MSSLIFDPDGSILFAFIETYFDIESPESLPVPNLCRAAEKEKKAPATEESPYLLALVVLEQRSSHISNTPITALHLQQVAVECWTWLTWETRMEICLHHENVDKALEIICKKLQMCPIFEAVNII